MYADAGADMFSPNAAGAKPYVYVPSAAQNGAGWVDVIDQATMKVVDRFKAGSVSQHVVPAWDLKTLYVTASAANQLVPIDPDDGQARYADPGHPALQPLLLARRHQGRRAGRAEQPHRLLRHARRGSELKSIPSTCNGNNHADWSADGSLLRRDVRVLRRPAEGRHGVRATSSPSSTSPGAPCPRTCGSCRTARSSTSPT